MSQETASSRNNTMLAFIAGAAVGAVIVALTTPKRGSELREDLAGMGRRAKGKMDDLAQQGTQAWEAFKDDASESGQDLREKASEAWQEVKKGASRASSELKQGLGDAAKDLRG